MTDTLASLSCKLAARDHILVGLIKIILGERTAKDVRAGIVKIDAEIDEVAHAL